MINKYKKVNNDKGSAMMVTIVVGLVVTVLCLSLILISYSLYSSTFNKSMQNQCKELAKSLSTEIQNEITKPDFATYNEQKEALNQNENSFWFYLRYNIWQSNWPYYNSDERGHTTPYAYRYFDLTYDMNKDYKSMADKITVCIYWDSEREVKAEDKDGTPLYVQVTCEKDDQSYTVTTTYELIVSEYSDVTSKEDKENTTNLNVNPAANSITQIEKWNWSFIDRE